MTSILGIESTIDALFQQLADWTALSEQNNKGRLIAKNSSDLGIHFCVELRADNFGYEKDGNTKHNKWERHYYSYIHIIILSERRVFVAISDKIRLEDISVESWENTSNHDSCYRSDGFAIFNQKYFEAYNHCWKHIPEEHQVSPLEANITASLSPMLRKPFRYVRVKHEAIDSKDSYWRKLTEIREVQYTIIIED